MIKHIITLSSLTFILLGCEKEVIYNPPPKEYTFRINGVVNKNGIGSLPKDVNGYYHLKLDSTKNQTVHRVNGTFLVNGLEPTPAEKIHWESNLYWWLKRSDTVALIARTYINWYTGKFTMVTLPPLIASKDELVPTINESSYTGTKGEFNIMIAPIYRMKGDTMVIKAYNYTSNLFRTEKIVLE